MTQIPEATLWAAIIGLGIGTYLIRWSFLGLIDGDALPGWATRLLRFVPVTVLPALVAPMVAWPKATGGEADPLRIAAAAAALIVGAATRHAIAAILAGMATLWLGPFLGL